MPNKKKEDSMNIQTTPEETVKTETPAGDATVSEQLGGSICQLAMAPHI